MGTWPNKLIQAPTCRALIDSHLLAVGAVVSLMLLVTIILVPTGTLSALPTGAALITCSRKTGVLAPLPCMANSKVSTAAAHSRCSQLTARRRSQLRQGYHATNLQILQLHLEPHQLLARQHPTHDHRPTRLHHRLPPPLVHP